MAPKPRDGKGLIVVIDDEVIILRGLKVVLENWGYTVIVATSEAEAMSHWMSALTVPT